MSSGKLKKTNGRGEHVSSRGAGLVLYGHPSDLAKLSNIRPGVYLGTLVVAGIGLDF